jgi:cell division protein FtsB
MSQGGSRREDRPAAQASHRHGTFRRNGPFLRRLWHSTRERWQRFALIGFVVWATYILLLSPQGWIQLWKLHGQAGSVQQEIASLNRQKDALDRMLVELDESGTFLLERRAREEFGYLRENEHSYVLPDDPEDKRCLDEAELHGGDCFSDRLKAARSDPRAPGE